MKYVPLIHNKEFLAKEYGDDENKIMLWRIQMCLEAMQIPQLSALEQLAFLIAIRKLLSQSANPPVELITKNTELINYLKEILMFLHQDFSNPDIIFVAYYMKLEITWILTNLCYGPAEISMVLLTEGQICATTGNLKLSIVVNHIKNCLLSNEIAMND